MGVNEVPHAAFTAVATIWAPDTDTNAEKPAAPSTGELPPLHAEEGDSQELDGATVIQDERGVRLAREQND